MRAVRLVILPNLYSKMIEQERHLLFLRALLLSLPLLSTVVFEYMIMALGAELHLKKSIGGHFGVWQCILNATQHLGVPAITQLYREKIARGTSC